MININRLQEKEIRKILEFKDDNENVEAIVIKNPNKKVRDEFIEVMTTKSDNEYYQIEYLMKELTNIELSKPLNEFLKNDYINPIFNDLLKELSSILFELVKELSLTLEVETEMDEAESLLLKQIKNDIQ
ncbi:hypothetical protein [Fusobacterium sp.]|uniref:hypothetical protein n=1 Tax=Fusobacterium sp. TaxID=68766 RepID=UPI0026251A63|nr:hypothetical protein [Fusobacterium sp.]